ncbi:hypothetical protein CRUP_025246, partial [Coryphaenoides rupestris]
MVDGHRGTLPYYDALRDSFITEQPHLLRTPAPEPPSATTRGDAMSKNGTFNNNVRIPGQRPRKTRDNGDKDDGYGSSADASPAPVQPVKGGRTHQELHKELLLAHKKGLVLSSKPELHKVLERRKKLQSEGEQYTQTPLEKVLFKRQQSHLEKEKQHDQPLWEDAEFVRVRQNLKKIDTAP